MTALLKAGRVNLDPLFGERMALDNFEAAFSKLQSGLAGKILMYPNGLETGTKSAGKYGTKVTMGEQK